MLRQTGPEFEAWLIDNGSGDGSVEFTARRFPNVHVLRLPQNLGFGKAYNQAIAQVKAPLVALLNNDTEVQPGWLEGLYCDLEAHGAAAVGGKLLEMERPVVVNHAGGGITLLGAAYDVGFGVLDGPHFSEARPVGCATGAAMLLEREAFLDVGGFDEAYFAYFEDADLCWRLWLQGYEVRYAPRARALHAYGGSTGRSRLSAFRVENCQTNRLQNMLKNLELGTLTWALPASLAYDALRLTELVRAGELAAARAHAQGTRKFLRLIGHVLDERRRVQAGRVRSDAELLRMGVLTGLREGAREWWRLGKAPAASRQLATGRSSPIPRSGAE
ncbi:MAG TPA: glycosyltransferase family 2 protein, partial [Chloroflexota bacterium]|nr:glycosyltransferase family 2 protein [Chloroflexota bacterium]